MPKRSAFNYVFEDPRWKRKMVGFGLISVLVTLVFPVVANPILMVIFPSLMPYHIFTTSAFLILGQVPLMGWFVELIRSSDNLQPNWRPLRPKIEAGIKVAVAALVYSAASAAIGLQFFPRGIETLIADIILSGLYMVGLLGFLRTNRFSAFFNIRQIWLALTRKTSVVGLLIAKLIGLAIVQVILSGLVGGIGLGWGLYNLFLFGMYYEVPLVTAVTLLLAVILVLFAFTVEWLTLLMPATYCLWEATTALKEEPAEVTLMPRE